MAEAGLALRACVLALSVSPLAACAVQVAALPVHANASDHTFQVVELSTFYKPARTSGLYLSSASVLGAPDRQRPWRLREVAAGAGYHLAFGRLAAELGPRLGVGQPVAGSPRGQGFLLAADLAVGVRLGGDADRRQGYVPVAASVDLLLFARAGVWAFERAGEGTAPVVAGGLALRFSVMSSLTDDAAPDWEKP